MDKKTPAPYEKQEYAKLAERYKDKPDAETFKKFRNNLALVGQSISDVDDKAYDKYRDTNWKKTVSKQTQTLYMAKDDPYFQTKESTINAGIDLRHLSYDQQSDNEFIETDETYYGGMAADIAVDVTATRLPIHFVMEQRALNNPKEGDFDEWFGTASLTRSAYILADQLPYNTYLMYGLYTPLFGLVNPDHTALRNQVVGINQRSRFKGWGVGGSPNVPFFNLSYLEPQQNTAFSQDEGIVANLGARFVTLGLSFALSYWDTEDKLNNTQRTMQSVDVGSFIDPLVLNFEVVEIERENLSSIDKVSLFQFQPKLRFWRENYITGSYTSLTSESDLSEGETTEWSVGLRSFLLSSTNLEFMYVNRDEEDETGNKVNTTRAQFQMHFFY